MSDFKRLSLKFPTITNVPAALMPNLAGLNPGKAVNDLRKTALLQLANLKLETEIFVHNGTVVIAKTPDNKFVAVTPRKGSNEGQINTYPLKNAVDLASALKCAKYSVFSSCFKVEDFPHTTMEQQLKINYNYLIDHLKTNDVSIKELANKIVSNAKISLANKQMRINMLILQRADLSKLKSICFGNSILNKAANQLSDPETLNLAIQGAPSAETCKLVAAVPKTVSNKNVRVFISVANVNDVKSDFNFDKTLSSETAMLLNAVKSFPSENITLISEAGRKILDGRTQAVFTALSQSPALKPYWENFRQIKIIGQIGPDGVHLNNAGYTQLLSEMKQELLAQSAAR